jgi:hypothetical protein
LMAEEEACEWATLALSLVLLCLLHLRLDLRVDLGLVIEIIGHRGVRLRQGQVGMLTAHLVGRPSERQVIHDDLGDADLRQALQARGLLILFLDM